MFQLKVSLIVLALINIALFEFFTAPKVNALAPNTVLPAQARFAGIASILLWLTVAACGRLIAYF